MYNEALVIRAENNVVQDIYHYTPNRVVAGIAAVLYLIAAIALFFRLIRRKNWWGLCLPIGALTTALGFFMRILLVSNQTSLGLYIISQLCIVVSPAAFLAFNYIVYGRLVVQNIGREYSLIRPDIVARVFVISDVTTFLVQSGGGSLEASQNPTAGKVGEKIFLVGLIVQAASYIVFILLFVHTHMRVHKAPRSEFPRTQPWWTVLWLLYFSSVFIVIRNVYRVTELAQGFGGFLLTHEVYFYVLDTLPLFIAIVFYIPWWPGAYLAASSDVTTKEYEMQRPPDLAHA